MIERDWSTPEMLDVALALVAAGIVFAIWVVG